MKKKEYIPDSIFDINLPDTADSERMVLADSVTFDDMFGDVVQVVTDDFFTSDDRRKIWRTIVENYNAGKGIDAYTIAQATGKPFVD